MTEALVSRQVEAVACRHAVQPATGLETPRRKPSRHVKDEVSWSHGESRGASAPEVPKSSEALIVASRDQRRLREKAAKASSELFEEQIAAVGPRLSLSQF